MQITPVRIGLLFDFPQGDDGAGFEEALRIGLDQIGAPERGVEVVRSHARGLPIGSEHELRAAWRALEADGVLAVVGPSISDNALIAAPLADADRLPAINYSGGERTRSDWMFHYQVGSLEEEPPVVARRMVEHGWQRAAVIFDASPVGRRYAEYFDRARAQLDLEVTASAAISPLSTDVAATMQRLRRSEPDVLCYFGLGMASRAVAEARLASGWEVPVLANSALMFGYARPDWRDGYAGWEYLDSIADDNPQRALLAQRAPHAAAGPIGVAAFDIGRLLGAGLAAADHLTRAGLADGLRRVKQLPAASGYAGTQMGFGHYEHAALKGQFLVWRTWAEGASHQVS